MSSDSDPPPPSPPSVYKIVKRFFKRTLKEKIRDLRYTGLGSELIGPKGLPLGYLNMPKAGCSTIKNILYYIEQGTWLEDPLEIHRVVSRKQALLLGKYFQHQRMRLEKKSPYFIFTFVRHPGRRVFSAFVEKILTTHEYAIPGIQRHLLENAVMMHRGTRITKLDGIPPLEEVELEDLRRNFKIFLRFVKHNVKWDSRFHPNPHWMPQSHRIDRLLKGEPLDFIGKVENFAEDFGQVLVKAGINQPELARRRFNEGPKPPFRYEEILDPHMQSMIRGIYAADLERFGYSED